MPQSSSYPSLSFNSTIQAFIAASSAECQEIRRTEEFRLGGAETRARHFSLEVSTFAWGLSLAEKSLYLEVFSFPTFFRPELKAMSEELMGIDSDLPEDLPMLPVTDLLDDYLGVLHMHVAELQDATRCPEDASQSIERQQRGSSELSGKHCKDTFRPVSSWALVLCRTTRVRTLLALRCRRYRKPDQSRL